ncbi:MAG: hypothetical protein ACK4SY_04170 [Pyrobaculum sp.]
MEVDYLIEKLGKYLGGIDVEKIKKILESEEAYVIRGAECRRVMAFLERYVREKKRFEKLYGELKALGVATSDLAPLKRQIRAVRRKIKMYREMSKRCSSQVSIFTDQAPEL